MSVDGGQLPFGLLAWIRSGVGEPCDVHWVAAEPIAGGAPSRCVQRLRLRVRGDGESKDLVVVRKSASKHETAGLRAAQAVRRPGSAIPELIADGVDADGPWLIYPWFPGRPLSEDDHLPEPLLASLARLHAAYHNQIDHPGGLPRIDLGWWQRLCREWVVPQLQSHASRHPKSLIKHAVALVTMLAAQDPGAAILAKLTPTLLHGDVHRGNIILDGEQVTLIDWGSSRIGPAMLDLANLVSRDSQGLSCYARRWQQVTGQGLDPVQVELGYLWADLQIPIQYLPWLVGHRPSDEVSVALDRITRAAVELGSSSVPGAR